jgi:uncharacterized membrane-anchored protein
VSSDVRHLALVLLWVVVLSQSLFVLRYGLTRGWRYDFVGRALFFKSVAVLAKAVVELLLWTLIPQLVDLIPTGLLVAVVLSDIALALGCTWQYVALERQKREDRHVGTELGREVDDAPVE